jgi:phosphoribosyl 1,2-cyclic phosphodiesterase
MGGKVMVFCMMLNMATHDKNVVKLAEDADLLIHDAQFTDEELKKRRGWGHSSFSQAIEVAEKANVKMLALTHHDPDHDDSFLRKMEKKCQERFKNCFLAREKMEIEIMNKCSTYHRRKMKKIAILQFVLFRSLLHLQAGYGTELTDY